MDQKPGRHYINRRTIFIGVGIFTIVALAVTSGFLYYKYQQVLHAPDAEQQLVSRIGNIIQLPTEQPTLLTIADKAKLTNPALAGEVQNNDQLLVYNNAKKIIVYRPSNQKVVAMFSVQADTAAAAKK